MLILHCHRCHRNKPAYMFTASQRRKNGTRYCMACQREYRESHKHRRPFHVIAADCQSAAEVMR